MADDEVARQETDGVGLRRGLGEVDDADAHLAGDGGDDLLLGEHSPLHQHLAEAAALLALCGQRVIEILLADEAARDEQGAQLEAAGHARLAAARQVVDPGAQIVDPHRLGDELRGAETVRSLERRIVTGGRHDQHGHALEVGVRAEQPEQLEAVGVREVEIEEDDRRGACGEDLDGVVAAGRDEQFVGVVERRADLVEQRAVLVDDRQELVAGDGHVSSR